MGITAHLIMSDIKFATNHAETIFNSSWRGNTYGYSNTSSLHKIDMIDGARKFYIGKEVNMLDNTFLSVSENDDFCMGPVSEFIRTPYHTCWIEILTPKSVGHSAIERYGYLTERILGHEVIRITPFVRAHSVNGQVGAIMWLPAVFSMVVKVGSNFNKDDISALNKMHIPITQKDATKSNYLFSFYLHEKHNVLPTSDRVKEDRDMFRNLFEAIAGSMRMCQTAILMLTAKNVFLSKISVSESANRKRAKNNKSQLYSYHTLVTRLERKRGKKSKRKSGVKMALHSVPGTFAFYTREKPLFGHLGPNNIGSIWKSEHMKGSIKNGNVDKDYCIKDPK